MYVTFISRTRWRVRTTGVAGLLLSFFVITAAPAVSGPPPLWIKQLGGNSFDNFEAVATDSAGNVVAVGRSDNADPWIAKFNAAGTLLWQKKPGPAELDQVNGVAVDGAGNSIVSITTSYPIDTWLFKYNAAGALLWSRRYDSGSNDFTFRVFVDRLGNVYTTGSTGPLASSTQRDVVLVKYSPAGVRLWAKIFGTDQLDDCNGIAVDKDNNVLVVGTTRGSFAGPDPSTTRSDAWFAKLDGAGNFLWKKQLDSLDADVDQGDAVAVDASGNVLVGGWTTGRFNAGSKRGSKAWLAKYSTGGVLRWIREYSAGRGPNILGLAANGAGEVFATGRSYWFSPSNGAFVIKYSSSGAFLRESLINSNDGASAQAVAVDRTGNPYVVGYTSGDLGGPNKGRTDAFLAKFPK